MTTPAKVRIFFPADPTGVVPGGIDTFIRGMVKWAPTSIDFSLVGMTTDPARRPVGRWTRCDMGGRDFDFFPVVSVADAGARGRVPLSVRFMAAAMRHRASLRHDFDVFDFHRLEPSLLYQADPRPKNAYIHQDPQALRLTASDNLWRRMPAAYERLEARAIPRLTSAWCVSSAGVKTLHSRYPAHADRVRFVPTWVDADTFFPAHVETRDALRRALAGELGISPSSRWIVSVGRLDTQKNPALLLSAFGRLCTLGHDAVLLMIGDGVLRRELERSAERGGIGRRVRFLGLRAAREIADWLRAADLFAMASAYEGMPMALLEALGCGTPAVVTDVGEVRRVLRPGVNGVIVTEHRAEAFAAALVEGLAAPAGWRAAALTAARAYQPAAVLTPVYDNYLELAQGFKALRLGPQSQAAAGESRDWPRSTVFASTIDALDADAVTSQIAAWAEAGESRTACFCNVHSAVLASRDECHRLALASADLVLPDGAPIAWALRRKGLRQQARVEGPGMMWRLCGVAAERGIKVGLYGSTPQVLEALQQRLRRAFPGLQIAYSHAPPFREATRAEHLGTCETIAQSGIGLLFVGLGCPKQERWMAQHRGMVPAVMLGVGAAFDFHAGVVRRAPVLMRDHGLEWLHRLGSDPRRLGWRYLSTNSMFVAKTVAQGLGRLRGAGRIVRIVGRGVTVDRGVSGRLTNPAALQPMAAAERRVPAVVSTPPPSRARSRRPRLDTHQLGALAARIDGCLPTTASRVIGFIASGSREGTTTAARAYALASAASLGRRVLLVSSALTSADQPGLIQALDTGLPFEAAITRRSRGVFVASLGTVPDSETAWSRLAREDLFAAMRQHFDVVALDMPASEGSSAGLRLAALCDGVVVIVEAEKTRRPVANHLIDNLRAVRATVLGAVLNKRRFQLPERMYRWL